MRKSQGYLLDDVTHTLGGAANFLPTGDYTFNNSSIVTFDFSSVDFSFINDMTSGTYSIGLSGLVSCSDTFTNCEYVSDDASSMHMVFDEFMFDESVAFSGEFGSSYEAVNALENLQMQIYSKPTVNASGASQVRYERVVTFTNLVLTVSWEENSSTGNTERLAITSQPLDSIVEIGETAYYNVSAQGTGLTYQWQYKAPNRTVWKNSPATGSNTSCLILEWTMNRDGYQYRCIITDESGNQIVTEVATFILVEEDTEASTEAPTESPDTDTDTEINSPDIPEDTEVIENTVYYSVSSEKLMNDLKPTYSGGFVGSDGETYLEAVYYDGHYRDLCNASRVFENVKCNNTYGLISQCYFRIKGLPAGAYHFTIEEDEFSHIGVVNSMTTAEWEQVQDLRTVGYGNLSSDDFVTQEHYLVSDGSFSVSGGEEITIVFTFQSSYKITSSFDAQSLALIAYVHDVHLKVYQVVNQADVQQNQLIEEGNKLQEESNKLQEEENEISGNILDKISDFFGGFFDNLINLFTSVFVPEDGYFEDYFARLNEFFSEKLGMLYVPIEILLEFLRMFLDSPSLNPGFYFPGVEWGGFQIIEPQSVNLSLIINQIPGLQDTIYFVSDVVLIFSVIYLLQNKLKEMLKT